MQLSGHSCGRPFRDFLILVTISAVLAIALGRPESAQVAHTDFSGATERSALSACDLATSFGERQKLESRGSIFQWLRKRPSDEAPSSPPVCSGPKASEPQVPEPKFVVPSGPEPGGLYSQQRADEELSIRGISTGQSLESIRRMYGQGDLNDRSQMARGDPGRVAHFRISYDRIWATLDRDGIVGGVRGNGLERYGVPILAEGDSAEDVERILGWPSQSGLARSAGRGAPWFWFYEHESYSLHIYFDTGTERITSFNIEDKDFTIPG